MLQNSAEFSKLLLPVISKISSKTAVLTIKDLFMKALAKTKAVFTSVLGVEPTVLRPIFNAFISLHYQHIFESRSGIPTLANNVANNTVIEFTPFHLTHRLNALCRLCFLLFFCEESRLIESDTFNAVESAPITMLIIG